MSRWSVAEEQALEILAQYMPYAAIAQALGRSEAAVKWKAIRDMGLVKRPAYQTNWTTLQERRLLEMRRQGYLLRDIAQELGVTYAAVRNHWWAIRRRSA